MAAAGQHRHILDMIALDAGEAAEFLAGAFSAGEDRADEATLPAGELASQVAVAHGSATEWENGQLADS